MADTRNRVWMIEGRYVDSVEEWWPTEFAHDEDTAGKALARLQSQSSMHTPREYRVVPYVREESK